MITVHTFRSDRIVTLAFVGILIFGAVLLLAAGPAPQLIFPSDDATYFDACHRESLGQVLGRDYTAPICPAAQVPTVLAMKLGNPYANTKTTRSTFVWLVCLCSIFTFLNSYE